MASPYTASEQNGLLIEARPITPDRTDLHRPYPAAKSSTPSPRRRPGYARIPSISVVDEESVNAAMDPHGAENDITQDPRIPLAGLGIPHVAAEEALKARRVSIQPAPRPLPSNIRDRPARDIPRSSEPFVSPPSTGGFSGSTRYDSPEQDDTSYEGMKQFGKQSMSSLHSSIQHSIYAKSDAGLVSVRSKYEDWGPHESCRSHKQVKQKTGNWVSVVIIILALFSTIFSAIFLVIAFRGPRYGRIIHTHGSLTASSAAFLTSFFAKLIELSFVTVLVAFLGQALARRAFQLEVARGVTLAELNMRSWITQPGTLLTQWSSVRYAGVTILGLVSLVSAICAMLYISAATALVQPQLRFPDWSPTHMRGMVKTEFANPTYIQDNCKTPILSTYDDDYGTTCIQLEHAAMGYHNYFQYLNIWTQLIENGSSPFNTDLAARPKGFALLNDNTTVTAPWIEQRDMSDLYQKFGVVVNNVSMAVPHPGVIGAAVDPINKIMQPAELDNLGMYNIKASVPSPVVHVLCTTMTEETLQPFVYELWPSANGSTSDYVDIGAWPTQLGASAAYQADPFLNHTVFHDIFHWGADYSPYAWPPVFAKLPIDYNTLLNDTTGVSYGRDSVYILGKGGDVDSVGNPTNGENYALCQLKASQTPNCSTHYNASSYGGTLAAVCEDPNDDFRYIRSLTNASSGSASLSRDWPNIASEWALSLALNDGYFEGNGSNARLLTQLIIPDSGVTPYLNPALPSPAEALAVMAGCTLLESAIDAPFVEFWNYSGVTTIEGQYQYFNASIRAQQYASGGTEAYQKGFYVVLFIVFAMNVVVLIYFCVHRDWFMDFTEPTNLFSLAVNSPPSKELAGSCGGGPAGEHFKVSWKLNRDGEHVFMESQERSAEEMEEEGSPGLRRRTWSQGFELLKTPLGKRSSKFELI